MVLKSRQDIEDDLLINSIKAGSGSKELYLKSIGFKGAVKDYVDVEFLSQNEPIVNHFVFAGLFIASLIGLVIFGVNVTGNAVGDTSLVGNSLFGIVLFFIGLMGFLLFRLWK